MTRAPSLASAESAHLEWDPDRLFWLVIEAPSWSGALPAGLLGALEAEAPLPADQLHAVCAPGNEGKLIVCAARTSELAALPPSVLSLTPSRNPPWIGVTSAPARLNLLVGRFEPLLIRRTRSRMHTVAAAAVLACAAIGSLGLMRRAHFQEARANSAARATAELVATSLGTGGGGDLDQLALEVSRFRRATIDSNQTRAAPDAAPTLAAILRGWPSLPVRTQSININPQGVAIEAAVEGNAAEFLEGFTAPAGWTLEEPRMVRVDSVTRLSLRLRRTEPPS